MSKTNSSDILAALRSLSSEKRAKTNAWFFKTKPGEYGEGDVFWGLSVPQIRQVAKKYKDLSLEEILSLLKHEVHEVRLCAVILLVIHYPKEPEKVFKAYLNNTKYINNWDLVDSSAQYIVGNYLQNRSKQALTKLAKSKSIWERRIAMIATYQYIKQGSPDEALRIAGILLHDPHDLIQKAVGWMLREIGKRCSVEAEEQFLNTHAPTMPRTTLRYALEHFPADKRRYYMERKNSN